LKHAIHFHCQILLPVGCRCTKQEKKNMRFGAILKKIIKTHKTTFLAYNISLIALTSNSCMESCFYRVFY